MPLHVGNVSASVHWYGICRSRPTAVSPALLYSGPDQKKTSDEIGLDISERGRRLKVLFSGPHARISSSSETSDGTGPCQLASLAWTGSAIDLVGIRAASRGRARGGGARRRGRGSRGSRAIDPRRSTSAAVPSVRPAAVAIYSMRPSRAALVSSRNVNQLSNDQRTNERTEGAGGQRCRRIHQLLGIDRCPQRCRSLNPPPLWAIPRRSFNLSSLFIYLTWSSYNTTQYRLKRRTI